MMLAWHVMDGADGQLARLTRQYSELGKVLDGICDYVTFTAVYVGLASALAYQYGGFVWGIVTVAGLCHAMQAAAYEAQRQEYDVWGWGKDSKRILPPQASLQAAASMPKPMLVLYRLYINVQLLMIGRKLVFQEQLDAFLLAHPDRSGTIGLQYRAFFAPIVRRWAVMSANYRTIGIFVFSILGVPLYYFLAEIFLLSAVLLVLSVMRIRQDRRFLAQLAI